MRQRPTQEANPAADLGARMWAFEKAMNLRKLEESVTGPLKVQDEPVEDTVARAQKILEFIQPTPSSLVAVPGLLS